MKKAIYCLVIIIALVLCSNVALAASASFGIALTSTKTEVNPGDEITVTLKVRDFQNINEGLYSFLAKIEYDTQFFETLTQDSIKGLGTWSSVPTFNPDTGLVVADSGSGVKTESDVFSVIFKVKETAQTGSSTQIIVKDFEASEGEEDLIANENAIININVITNDNNNDEEDNNDNNNNEDNLGNNGPIEDTNDNNNNNNDNSDTKDDTTSSTDKKLPQTGENAWVVASLAIVAIAIAIVSYKSYKKYGNI